MSVELKPGARMEWRRSFSEADIRQFAELSGDKGVHHLEPDEQGRLMAHGLLTASLPTKLGGDLNYIARTMKFDFFRPVFAGEELTCVGVVDAVESGPRGRLDVSFSFTVTNPKGKSVLSGTSSGVILKVAAAVLLLFGAARSSFAQGQKAVIVGDSHTVGPFGRTLVDGMLAQGWSTAVYSVCGASLTWWLYGDGDNRCGYWFRSYEGREEQRLGKRIGKHFIPAPRAPHRQNELARLLLPKAPANPPDIVVIELGANEDDDFVAVGTELLKNRISPSSRCYWVRPPPVPHDTCVEYDRANFESDFETIKRQSGRDCELIDSTRFLDSSWSSGCHYDNACGKQWGQRASEQITGAMPPFQAADAPVCSKPKPPLPRARRTAPRR